MGQTPGGWDWGPVVCERNGLQTRPSKVSSNHTWGYRVSQKSSALSALLAQAIYCCNSWQGKVAPGIFEAPPATLDKRLMTMIIMNNDSDDNNDNNNNHHHHPFSTCGKGFVRYSTLEADRVAWPFYCLCWAGRWLAYKTVCNA